MANLSRRRSSGLGFGDGAMTWMSSHENSTDGELLRQALIAESDAVSLYIQLARKAKTNIVKELLLDLAQEERVHIGEITEILNKFQETQNVANKEASEELKEKNNFK